jgi:hypothetical protein
LTATNVLLIRAVNFGEIVFELPLAGGANFADFAQQGIGFGGKSHGTSKKRGNGRVTVALLAL